MGSWAILIALGLMWTQREADKAAPLADSLRVAQAWAENRAARADDLQRSYRSAAYVVDSLERRVQQAEGLLSYLQQDSLCRVR